MKNLALDIGDVWTGTAISDALGMFARPYQTVETKDLVLFLTTVLQKEPIKAVVVGHPTTMRGTKTAQTIKVEEKKQELESLFAQVEWLFWDESYTSQLAEELKPARSKEEKRQSHSIAAAYILSSYLDHLQFLKNGSDDNLDNEGEDTLA
ncbi:MAG TPA: Holliday junction resolvase RuvX [Candidatus Babeliales bacterium]|nr:Holliday junction resolvase RuvX [Candidatus Babeliales bacterium]